MTDRQKQLIENYVRTKVKNMLNEASFQNYEEPYSTAYPKDKIDLITK